LGLVSVLDQEFGGVGMVCEGVLRGLVDKFGAGADFPGGILQGGEGEAWVAKFSEMFPIFLLLAQGSRRNEEE
jgi:hypothetical protein